jgi:hypothetical protein
LFACGFNPDRFEMRINPDAQMFARAGVFVTLLFSNAGIRLEPLRISFQARQFVWFLSDFFAGRARHGVRRSRS